MIGRRKWFGGGCGFVGITDQPIDSNTRAYLRQREEANEALNKASPHNSVNCFNPRFYCLDPLISPLILALNELDIQTITSCQGKEFQSPYVFFYGTLTKLSILDSILLEYRRKVMGGWFWETAAIIYEGEREDKATWVLNFYDVMEMIRISQISFGCEPPKGWKYLNYNYKKQY